MSAKKKEPAGSGMERRRTERRPILSTFSLFAVVPCKGIHRLPVHDVSEHGIGFDLDTEGEQTDSLEFKEGQDLDIHLYLNQSLYIPLSVRIKRLEIAQGVRRVGAEFIGEDQGYIAFQSFLKMLDSIVDAVQVAD